MMRRLISFIYKNIRFRKQIQLLNELKIIDISLVSEIELLQIRKLKELLSVAVPNVPFYRDFQNFDINNLKYDDFVKLPLMSKELIKTNGAMLINSEASPYLMKAYKNTSGGSTGEPIEIFRTKHQDNHGVANYYYANFLNGVNIYDKSVDLWGAKRDMHNLNRKFDLNSFLNNKIRLNTFVLSDAIIEQYIKILNLHRPKFIKAYVHSIYEISKFINRRGIKMSFTPVIHCTTGPLYPDMKLEIEQAFNHASVYNFYGSREVSAIATSVANQNDMYVLFDNVLVEVLDSNNNPVKAGEEGEIVVTTLNNHYMPLIRYKIGDRAIKGDNHRFGTLKLKSVLGRTLGVIYTEDGRSIDGQFFTTLFFNKVGIKSFQLIQKSIFALNLIIVKEKDFHETILDNIIEDIKAVLPRVTITINFSESIDLTSTGKIMYVYSEVNR